MPEMIVDNGVIDYVLDAYVPCTAVNLDIG